MKAPESAVLRACLDYLRLRGHFAFRANSGAFRTESGGWVRCTDTPGIADIVGVTVDGKALAVECKSDRGKQSKAQRLFEENWADRHGLYVLARSLDDLVAAGL